MKFNLVLIAFAAAASAAAIQEGGKVTDPLENYTIEDLAIDFDIDGETRTFSGTAEKIMADVLALKPDFQFNGTEYEAPENEKRNAADIICNIGGGQADDTSVMQCSRYLTNLGTTPCRVNGRSCIRVACHGNAGTYLCNDNGHAIAPHCNYVAHYLGNIMRKCLGTTLSHCRTCPISQWSRLVNGQQFDTDRYNIIVRRDSC